MPAYPKKYRVYDTTDAWLRTFDSWKAAYSFCLTNFGYGVGDVIPYLGLFGCKSEEIAKHMSRYFSREIFEATYSNIVEYRFLKE